MIDERWYINKVGLLNFWYYDEEEFEFSNGKLLLRGSNGSGKSVTMQSFIPLLLDGNKSPTRLDPFGSRARRIENYLIDEDEDREERTAYLYMEFKKRNSNKYITIGIGFKAQRGRRLQSWGFSISDGRRIGHDFFLYKDIGDKIPLTKKELENRLENGGRVTEGQKEYMIMVNSLLFGFEDIEEYDEMIKLLIQLRTPKLSKEFKPSVVYEIMENSLQQLSEDDLRPMSEAIENMDNIKIKLEELKESKKAAGKIRLAYDKYNRIVLYNKAKDYMEAYKINTDLVEKKREAEEDRITTIKKYESAQEYHDRLELEEELLLEKREQLIEHDSFKIKENILKNENMLEEAKIEILKKNRQLDHKKVRERELYSSIQDYMYNIDVDIKKTLKFLEDMDTLAQDFDFDEYDFMKKEIEENLKEAYDFSYIIQQLKVRIEKLNIAKVAIEERDSCNTEHDRLLGEIDKLKETKLLRERSLELVETLVSETKEELVEKIFTWENRNIELKMDRDDLIELSRKIQNFSDGDSYDRIISIVRQTINFNERIFNKKIANFDSLIEQLDLRKVEIEDKIEELQKSTEIEPTREEKVKRNRKNLEEKNIPFIPLYKALDFKDNLDINVAGVIEEAIIDMGLLDALIIADEYKEKALLLGKGMGDKYIFSSPNLLTHSLEQFLRIEKLDGNNISRVDIDNVLKSILIDKGNQVFINEKGQYGIGIIRGKTSMEYKPKYIGIRARERHRQEQLEILNNELKELIANIKHEEKNRDNLSERLERLNLEFKHMPMDEDLHTALDSLRDARNKLESSIIDLKEKEDEEKKIYLFLGELRQKVNSLTHNFKLKPYIDIYITALDSAYDFQENLYNLESSNKSIINNRDNLRDREEQRENIEFDIGDLNGELVTLERKKEEAKTVINSLKEQLSITDHEVIEKEINYCLQRLKELPALIKGEYKKIIDGNNRLDGIIQKLADINEKIVIAEEDLAWKTYIFKKDFELNLCGLKDKGEDYKNANMVIQEIKPRDKSNQETRSNLLFEQFNENNQYLRDYILRIESKSLNRMGEEEISRVFINGRVRGKEIGFHQLLDFIEEGVKENESLLKESDRQLFEDILVNNISKKIRAKIYHSQNWVSRMNGLMEGMNTSSGLSFSLNWVSKRAESEGQLDTRELVNLLNQEAGLMKERDLNKLSEHFRAKITEARRIQENLEKNQSFHTIMREVLDYRRWFEFKLSYKKTDTNKKELTNNAFYQLSGGEKAMAMYVPLFSAVYAKFKGARIDSPRIISLDEAFAGVDENNIRDMFKLLDELDLDYMINSQILWGDYDTVSSLAISELIRPDNAKFVTVIRYLWDGQSKELVV